MSSCLRLLGGRYRHFIKTAPERQFKIDGARMKLSMSQRKASAITDLPFFWQS
jgi:hypothetical protein